MRILIADGERRFQPSGYGALSRSISLALLKHSEHNVFFEPSDGTYVHDVPDMVDLLTIPSAAQKNVDFILRIGQPAKPVKHNKPCLIYTQNALGSLRSDWIERLAGADGIVVPGKFDEQVYRQHFKTVFTCPQHVDANKFRPVPRWRSEGPDVFSFLFVGSYSFRKGVDLLPAAFSRAFADGTKVHLHLHCFSGLERERLTQFFQSYRTLPDNVSVSCFAGEASPDWMVRFYNRHDAVITLSRGEGWCMPLHEGLLCGKPVIAPDSTAMGEALPQSGVYRVAVRERRVDALSDPFAASMIKTYGHPGNFFWEPDIEDAARALRQVYSDRADLKKTALAGREYIRHEYSLPRIAQDLSDAIQTIMAAKPSS